MQNKQDRAEGMDCKSAGSCVIEEKIFWGQVPIDLVTIENENSQPREGAIDGR